MTTSLQLPEHPTSLFFAIRNGRAFIPTETPNEKTIRHAVDVYSFLCPRANFITAKAFAKRIRDYSTSGRAVYIAKCLEKLA